MTKRYFNRFVAFAAQYYPIGMFNAVVLHRTNSIFARYPALPIRTSICVGKFP